MQPYKWLLSLGGLLIASLILAISLISSTPSAYSVGDEFKTNDKEFYFGTEILPDHLLYPAVMIADKIKLETAKKEEKLITYITYANLRLDSSEKLLNKDSHPLALTTLTKSQKYLLKAAEFAQENHPNPTATLYVYKTLLYHLSRHQQLMERFSDEQRPVIEQLDREILVFVDSLKRESGL